MRADSTGVSSSFRDPSGFLFMRDGVLLRQINRSYQEDYDHLKKSGLYRKLVEEKLLIPFREVSLGLAETPAAYKVIRPEPVPFISYPYEWSFSQLKDAATSTLRVEKIALDYGMTLKDASAYNIQFVDGNPVLIDTLSFEIHKEKPWVAYRQFCQHFLAPLALASYTDVRLTQLMRIYIDGVPLDLAINLLPRRAFLKPNLLAHLYLHAKSQQFFAGRGPVRNAERELRFRKDQLRSLIGGLAAAVRDLKWEPKGTEWADYYEKTNYSSRAFKQKAIVVEKFIKEAKPKTVWDLGANTGTFSRISSNRGIPAISFDIDPAAVEINYRQVRDKGESKILPLVMDLTNPSGGIGWANQERRSLIDRGPADTVMALALIHHLAISNNLPFGMIAKFMAEICREFLIIEFVPKEDSQVQRLLSTREDIFDHYTQSDFEREFGKMFTVMGKDPVKGSKRTVYLFKRKI